MNGMERVSLRMPTAQLEELDQLVEAGEYPNRSEAIRAAVRKLNEPDPPIAEIVREDQTRGRGTFRWGDS